MAVPWLGRALRPQPREAAAAAAAAAAARRRVEVMSRGSLGDGAAVRWGRGRRCVRDWGRWVRWGCVFSFFFPFH